MTNQASNVIYLAQSGSPNAPASKHKQANSLLAGLGSTATSLGTTQTVGQSVPKTHRQNKSIMSEQCLMPAKSSTKSSCVGVPAPSSVGSSVKGSSKGLTKTRSFVSQCSPVKKKTFL